MWHSQTKFMTHWVHPWQQPLYTHPPSHPGACFSSLQEGQVPILLLLLSLTDYICTHPSMSVQPYPSCSGTQSKNETAITPEHQSSDVEPQHAMTTVDPYSIHINGITQL